MVLVRREGGGGPQLLRVRFADGSVREARFDGAARWQRFRWDTPSKAVSAQLDPDGHLAMDLAKHNDGRTLQSDGRVARRWGADLAALLHTFLALLAYA